MPEPTAPDSGPDSTARPGPSRDGRPISDATVPPMPSEVTDTPTTQTHGHRTAAGGLRRVTTPMRKMMRRTARRP